MASRRTFSEAEPTPQRRISSYPMRKIQAIVPAETIEEGIHRTIGSSTIQSLNPFVSLDDFDTHKGYKPHPHRGVTTLTYVYPYSQNFMLQQSSQGAKDIARAGTAQVLNAGKGITHAENAFQAINENVEGFQLSFLQRPPDREKEGRLRRYGSWKLSPYSRLGVDICLLNGVASGLEAHPRHYLDFGHMKQILVLYVRMKPYSMLRQHVPGIFNGGIYSIQGSVEVNPSFDEEGFPEFVARRSVGYVKQRIETGVMPENTYEGEEAEIFERLKDKTIIPGRHFGLFSSAVHMDHITVDNLPIDEVCLVATEEGCDLIFLAGQPLPGDIVKFGPFYGTSEEDVKAAMEDFEKSQNGFENAQQWMESFDITKY